MNVAALVTRLGNTGAFVFRYIRPGSTMAGPDLQTKNTEVTMEPTIQSTEVKPVVTYQLRKMPGEVGLLKFLGGLNLVGGLVVTAIMFGDAASTSPLGSAFYTTLAIYALAESILGSTLLYSVAAILTTLVNIENGIIWRNWNK